MYKLALSGNIIPPGLYRNHNKNTPNLQTIKSIMQSGRDIVTVREINPCVRACRVTHVINNMAASQPKFMANKNAQIAGHSQ